MKPHASAPSEFFLSTLRLADQVRAFGKVHDLVLADRVGRRLLEGGRVIGHSVSLGVVGQAVASTIPGILSKGRVLGGGFGGECLAKARRSDSQGGNRRADQDSGRRVTCRDDTLWATVCIRNSSRIMSAAAATTGKAISRPPEHLYPRRRLPPSSTFLQDSKSSGQTCTTTRHIVTSGSELDIGNRGTNTVAILLIMKVIPARRNMAPIVRFQPGQTWDFQPPPDPLSSEALVDLRYPERKVGRRTWLYRLQRRWHGLRPRRRPADPFLGRQRL